MTIIPAAAAISFDDFVGRVAILTFFISLVHLFRGLRARRVRDRREP